MAVIKPYKISVPDSSLAKLSQKLSLTSFPDELQEAAWEYGAPLADIKRLTAYWRETFSWRDVEASMNKLPSFHTSVHVDGFESLDIHFVHCKSKVEAAIPLLFVHGWPGSFLEVSKLLPLLTDGPGPGPTFHIVAPSLPNFGFSQGTTKKGFGIAQHAETCHKLMLRLGYEEYVTQGGDWGSTITRAMGKKYPFACKASHLNLVAAGPPAFTSHPFLAIETVVRYMTSMFSPQDRRGLERSQDFQENGMGYFHLQRSKPQTLGYALADSPVALLAWMYEKLHDWTDEYPWTEDEILTWVSLYYFSTAGPAASVRLYYEAMHSKEHKLMTPETWVPNVKLGLAYFPKEVIRLPTRWGYTLGPVVHVSENESGGHFAAWERPDCIAADLRAMFARNGGAYGVVNGRDGYE